jgi:SOS-response transcriptional repressor LexA
MTLPRLTRSERAVLDFIRDFINLHGISPTYEEIARGLGKRSKGSVHGKVSALIAHGFVTRATDGLGTGRRGALALSVSATYEVCLPDDLDAFVRHVAASTGVSPAAVIVEAVRDAKFSFSLIPLARETLAPAGVTVTPPTGATLEAAE